MTSAMDKIREGLDLRPVLDVRNVSRFYGDRIGCAQASFRLWPGVVLGIVGESGSGKSTLLRFLAGLDPPTGGEVILDACGWGPDI